MLSEGVIFHQDNAPAHASEKVQGLLATLDFEVLKHAPYSPDKAPSDFFLFTGLKDTLRGRRFDDFDDLKNAVSAHFRKLSREDFTGAYLDWVKRHQKCVLNQGEYFETL